MIAKNQNQKISLSGTIDFVGFSDYWTGHGHAFADKELIACIRFQPSIDYSETVKDIKKLIFDDIQALWYVDYPNDNEEEYSILIDNISDDDLKEAIEEMFIEGHDENRRLEEDEEPIKEDDENFFDEYPCVIGWIHVYLDTSDNEEDQ